MNKELSFVVNLESLNIRTLFNIVGQRERYTFKGILPHFSINYGNLLAPRHYGSKNA